MNGRRQPSIPPKIPGFEYVGLLGMGGFADVFEYRQDFPRRPVAVKVLLSTSLDAGARDSFFAEANIMARLSQHPSIVTIHQAAIASDGRPYFVMEFCAKPSLGARFRSERISVAETLRTGVRVASAVETAHRSGVLHRDIKPANILATDFGWPALTDFGIAGAVGDKLAAAGMSIPWAPPEMLLDEPYGDARSDVYSLGATMYSLLAGRSPFELPGQSNSPTDLITRIERAQLPAIGRIDVPQELDAVLARAMARDPNHRFSSALAFAHALQNIERQLQLPVTGVDVPDITPTAPQTSAASPAKPASERSVTVVRGQDTSASSAHTATGLAPSTIAPSAHSAPLPSDTTGGPGNSVLTGQEDIVTRMRSVSTINPEVETEADKATRLRPITTINYEIPEQSAAPAQGQAPGTPGQQGWSAQLAQRANDKSFEPRQFEDTDDKAPDFYDAMHRSAATGRARRRRGKMLITVVSLLALIAMLVYIGQNILNNEAPTGNSTEPIYDDAPDLNLTDSVPSVINLRVAQQSDSSVTFTWDNPQPAPGDSYLWRVVNVTGSGTPTRTDTALAQIPLLDDSDSVCVEVSLVRENGKASTTPTRECTE
ncbi:serine/threonine-protein kinase [Jonesia quinghaiensis]|uniref:serine/threonine-protein kinase n=1 Tax=Jonesia quinghaiensis TaxID=262806 RepID=UPI0004218DAD|nr:serine/threonine-protein kinase [Jonesia quinghaiensis]